MPMDDGDLRHKAQNRLLVVTATLAFFYYAGATFENVSIAGTTIRFKNENAIPEFLWLIWLYYFVRCYQYFLSLGAAEYRSSLNDSYLHELGHVILNMERHEFTMLPPDDPVRGSLLRVRPAVVSERDLRDTRGLYVRSLLPQFLRRGLLYRDIESQLRRSGRYFGGLVSINFLRPRSKVQRMLRRLTLPFTHLGMKVTVYPPSNREDLQGREKYVIYLGGSATLHLTRILVRSLLLRPAFTETYGPLILGLTPVYYLIFQNWGNIQALFGG